MTWICTHNPFHLKIRLFLVQKHESWKWVLHFYSSIVFKPVISKENTVHPTFGQGTKYERFPWRRKGWVKLVSPVQTISFSGKHKGEREWRGGGQIKTKIILFRPRPPLPTCPPLARKGGRRKTIIFRSGRFSSSGEKSTFEFIFLNYRERATINKPLNSGKSTSSIVFRGGFILEKRVNLWL